MDNVVAGQVQLISSRRVVNEKGSMGDQFDARTGTKKATSPETRRATGGFRSSDSYIYGEGGLVGALVRDFTTSRPRCV